MRINRNWEHDHPRTMWTDNLKKLFKIRSKYSKKLWIKNESKRSFEDRAYGKEYTLKT